MSKKNTKKTTAKTERYVYLAPSCGGFVHHTVFVGEEPAKLKEMKEKFPEINRFIVPESKAGILLNRLRDSTDPLTKIYNNLASCFKEVK